MVSFTCKEVCSRAKKQDPKLIRILGEAGKAADSCIYHSGYLHQG